MEDYYKEGGGERSEGRREKGVEGERKRRGRERERGADLGECTLMHQ